MRKCDMACALGTHLWALNPKPGKWDGPMPKHIAEHLERLAAPRRWEPPAPQKKNDFEEGLPC